MSSTVRPDNLRAALDAKLAAAMSQLAELREAEQPRVTHLNPREIIDTFLLYACRVYPIADTFGREQAGDLQFEAWYGQWLGKLDEADRALWQQLRDERERALIEAQLPVHIETQTDTRKRLVRFAGAPTRAASDVCADYLRLAKRFVGEFLRDYARFLPER
jgi:hypothetical protein